MAVIVVSRFVPLLFMALISNSVVASESHGAVFKLKSKFSWQEGSLRVLRAHDSNRHLKPTSTGADISIGGSGRPDSVGGYPSKEYNVQVDTGGDLTWINCKRCPNKLAYQGRNCTLYDPNASFTGQLVTCDEEICKDINGGRVDGCKPNASCLYNVEYGDRSSSTGNLVKDVVQYDSVFGDFETKLANGSIIFGCGTIQSGNLDSSEYALDGILGFGNSNASFISQLASSGKVKKMFAHCLDGGVAGGGIFAIGHVVHPKVTSTHLIKDQVHYTVNVTGIEVGAEFLKLSTDSHGGVEKRKAIIDSGTTLAYLPEVIYKSLVNKIVAGQSNMSSPVFRDPYTCIEYIGSVDNDFPAVTFHFEDSLSLKVDPHDYMFGYGNLMCLGWQKNETDDVSTRDSIVLGDLILVNKLVLYDLEEQTVGWTEYNCSSSISLKDDITGLVHLVGSHNDNSISSALSLIMHRSITFSLLFSLLVIMLIS